MAHEAKLKLPAQVISLDDVSRLLRELNNVNEAMLQLKLRSPHSSVKLPQTSHNMEQLLELNKLNLLHETDRISLSHFLQAIKLQAPVLHMSFSSIPSRDFLEKVVMWFRKEVHDAALLSVGLQPTIGAGCVLRGTNKYFDLSLKQTFMRSKHLLTQELVPKEAKL